MNDCLNQSHSSKFTRSYYLFPSTSSLMNILGKRTEEIHLSILKPWRNKTSPVEHRWIICKPGIRTGVTFLSSPCTYTEVQNTIETDIFPSCPVLYLPITTNNHCNDESELDRTYCRFKGKSYQAILSDVSAQNTSETEQVQANVIIP